MINLLDPGQKSHLLMCHANLLQKIWTIVISVLLLLLFLLESESFSSEIKLFESQLTRSCFTHTLRCDEYRQEDATPFPNVLLTSFETIV